MIQIIFKTLKTQREESNYPKICVIQFCKPKAIIFLSK